MSDLSNPIFHDTDKAREWLETRIWPNGPICPKCGVIDKAKLMEGKSHRPGLYQCNACREPFTVTVGTLYERSHVPLNKWLAATHLLMASKKGISALQVHRMLGISKKTAWFLCHRIRESLRETKYEKLLGGKSKTVEVDETYIGGKAGNRKNRQTRRKEAVVALVERGGAVRSFPIHKVNSRTMRGLLRKQVSKKSRLMTDDSVIYKKLGEKFATHDTVNHSIEEYVRGGAYTNTVENYFSILKRGVNGVYHHISEQHLKRYLAEFDFRYNERSGKGVSDAMRAEKAIQGIVGKRLTYRRIDEEAQA